jgi:ribosomal protein S18 acetylase RimI-like enzyme
VSAYRIELLSKHHVRDGFDCGEESLNVFLQSHAGQNTRRDISRTYVALLKESDVVAGYYTLSSGSIAFVNLPDQLSRKLPKYPVPTAHLGRLAVDKHSQGQGLGGMLLVDALKRVQTLADKIGIYAVSVDALNDNAKRFYEAYGFVSLRDDSHHLLLPMATIRQI